ncbi:hypothetical protein V6B08_19800 [Ferrovibrio sp. MS7]|uniref:hypothetical protein n=1 Tax=Ferrovibrio plantarum TaxID=3119164 RepID=UPI003136F9F8
MVENIYRASVQYNDWKGTAAADDADKNSLSDLLTERGLMNEGEFLLSAHLWVGEVHGGELGSVFVCATITQLSNADAVESLVRANCGPLPVKRVELELSLGEFVVLFKRFAVVLTSRDLNLTDFKYSYED